MTGIIFESVAWIYKIMITLIVVVIAVWIVGSSIAEDVNTREVQKQLLLSRILYSPDSLWYENTMLHPGVVDLSKFNQQRIDAAFQYPDLYGGANLTLVRSNAFRKSVVIEPENYKLYASQHTANIRGGGRVETHAYPVQIRTENTIENGYLIIELAVPERT